MGFIMVVIQIIISVILPVWLFLWFSHQIKKQFPSYSKLGYNMPDIQFLLKRWWAEWSINAKERGERVKLQNYDKNFRVIEYARPRSENSRVIKDDNSSNSIFLYGTDQKGNSVFVKFARRRCRTADISLQVTTSDGQLYVLPDCPETVVTVNPDEQWSAIGLKIELLESYQRWRVTYNGLLQNVRRGNVPSDDNVEHVRINLIFVANSRSLKWPGDWSSKLHSDALAREPWRSPEWMNKIKLLDYTGYDQWGSMLGQLTFKDSSVNTLYLRGICQHRSGKHESHQFHKSVTLYGVTATGSMIYVGASNTKHSFPQIQFGHLRDPLETTYSVDWTDLNLTDFTEQKCIIDTRHKIRILAGETEYSVGVKFCGSTNFYSGQPWNWVTQVVNIELELNGKPGVGIMQLWYPYNKAPPTKVPVVRPQYLQRPTALVNGDDYVLNLTDEKCQLENVVGGKGFSLAMLTSIKDADFTVPEGFCVTVFAFELQIKTHKEIYQAIDELENISTGKKSGDLKKQCEEVERVMRSTPIVEPVKLAILKALEKIEETSQENHNRSYAVRSSAVGEDSEETSAAGQNSTYLGVNSTDGVVTSVAKCWASLFTYKSVEYRRQHGLRIKNVMGVCVQRMVNAEAAGVLFTRHPTTGDPSQIIVTANFGLGESVVSAIVEPDTITIHRSWDDRLAVKNTILGKKTQKISMSDDGVSTKMLEKQETEKVSISEKTALRLAAIGLQLESLFGIGRDIEWATVDDKILLLQSRPITTLYAWTDFELTHELDSGVPNDVDVLTFANLGEVLPYPVSPLSISTVIRVLNAGIAKKQGEPDANYVHITSMRCSLNYFNSFLRIVEKEITMANKVVDLAVAGKVIITPEIHRTALERDVKVSTASRLRLLYEMIKEPWYNSSVEKRAQMLSKGITLNPYEYVTAHNLYHEINKKFREIYEISLCHMYTSRVCVAYQLLAIILLTRNNTDIGANYFSDIAVVVGSCSNVIGTEIPIALGQIVRCIKRSGKAEEFNKLKSRDIIEWLQTNCHLAAKRLERLLKEHGHRCVQEMDLFSESWSLNPETLVVTIQMLMKSSGESIPKKQLSVSETVESLKTANSRVTKWLLGKIIPLYRKAVTSREATKSVTVNGIHKMKLAYRRLGQLMVSEGYLPNNTLVFFLTHKEIGRHLDNREPALVQKAQRRYRLYPRLKELRYHENNVGVPEPIQINSIDVSRDGYKIEGTTVCGGSLLGRACVIKDVVEGTEIQQGDILITHSTDIAWSTYFPLLGGIVTELGGLISHGAVVAREYGLPCIIGAMNATEIFQTGDTVLLAADVGTLQLIKRN